MLSSFHAQLDRQQLQAGMMLPCTEVGQGLAAALVSPRMGEGAVRCPAAPTHLPTCWGSQVRMLNQPVLPKYSSLSSSPGRNNSQSQRLFNISVLQVNFQCSHLPFN